MRIPTLHQVFCLPTSALLDYITSGPVVAFEIVGENAINAWREAIGPTDPSEARKTAPTSIRAQYGTGLCGSTTLCGCIITGQAFGLDREMSTAENDTVKT